MDDAEKIRLDNTLYINQVKRLKVVRDGLAEKLKNVAKNELLPAILPYVPSDYSINPDETIVDFPDVRDIEEHPRTNGVSLMMRLRYDKNDTGCIDKEEEMVRTLNRQCQQTFKEFVDRYGLAFACLCGESVMIGEVG